MTEQSYKYEDYPHDPLLKLKQSLKSFTTAVSNDATQLRSYNEYSVHDSTQQHMNDNSRTEMEINMQKETMQMKQQQNQQQQQYQQPNQSKTQVSSMNKTTRKGHQRASLQFLSKQLQRLSNIEHQLIHLTDEVLLTNDTPPTSNNDRITTTSNNSSMTMEELSSVCKMLHSHHAKYLIQIEEILHDRFGYVHDSSNNSQKEEENNCNSENGTNKNTYSSEKENEHNDHNSNNNIHKDHENVNKNRENIIINPLLGQPLNRLSEADIETDIGSTRTSCTPSAHSISTMNTTSSAIQISQAYNTTTSGRGSLSSVPLPSSISSSASSFSSLSSPYRNNQNQNHNLHHQRHSLPYIRNGVIVSPKEFINHSMIESTSTTAATNDINNKNKTIDHDTVLDEEQDLQEYDTILESNLTSLKISGHNEDRLSKGSATSFAYNTNAATATTTNTTTITSTPSHVVQLKDNNDDTWNQHDRSLQVGSLGRKMESLEKMKKNLNHQSFIPSQQQHHHQQHHHHQQQHYSKVEDEYLNLLIHNHKKSNHNHNNQSNCMNQSQDTSMDLLDDTYNNHDGTMSIASTVVCERKRNEYGMYADDSEEENNEFGNINEEIKMKNQQSNRSDSHMSNNGNNFIQRNKVEDYKSSNNYISELDKGYIDGRMKEIIEASIQYMSPSPVRTSLTGRNSNDVDDIDDENGNDNSKISTDEYLSNKHISGANIHSNTTRKSIQAERDETSKDLSSSTLSHVHPTTLTSELFDATNGEQKSSQLNHSRRKQTLDSVSRALHTRTSISEMEEPNFSKEEEKGTTSSPLDKFEVQLLNGGRDVKVVSQKSKSLMNGVVNNIAASPRTEDVTSPLDRFQVQVLNGGTEAKVMPIEKEFLSAIQSPITKIKSPFTQHDSRNMINHNNHVNLQHNSHESGIKSNIDFNNISPTFKSRKVYAKAPMPKAEEDISLSSSSLASSFKEDSGVDLSPQQSINLVTKNAINKVHKSSSCITPSVLDSNKKTSATAIRTPLAAAWIKKNISGEKDRLLKVLSGGKAIPSSPSSRCSSSSSLSSSSLLSKIIPENMKKTLHKERLSLSGLKESAVHEKSSMVAGADLKQKDPKKTYTKPAESIETLEHFDKKGSVIKNISPEEYEDSPRVVQIQVTFDELNRAVNVLNEWTKIHLRSDNNKNGSNSRNGNPNLLNLEEKEANTLLEKEFNISRKAKSLLMSLCFFRRITLQLSPGNTEKHFVIPLK